MNVMIWLFPLVFLFHEIEEIVGFESWLEENEALVKEYNLLKNFHRKFSQIGFIAAVGEELVLCLVITVLSYVQEAYLIWIGTLAGFSIHLVIHILQRIVLRRKIPAFISSVMLMPVCVALLWIGIASTKYTEIEIILSTLFMSLVIIGNLFLAHGIMGNITKKFDRI